MIRYKKIYCDFFGYKPGDFVPSELSGGEAVDIHHIIYKSRGGKDVIENLMALTFKEHEDAHQERLKPEYLQEVHNEFMKKHGIN